MTVIFIQTVICIELVAALRGLGVPAVLLLTLCLLANSRAVQAQPCTSPDTVPCIRQRYAAVQKQLPTYRSMQRAMDSLSTEGGNLKAYFEGQHVRLIKISLFGETGRIDQEYYYTDTNRLFFVFEKHHRYGRQFGKVAQVQAARFYFHDGKLIRWLNNTNKPVSPSDPAYLAQQQQILEFSQRLLQVVLTTTAETATLPAASRQALLPQPFRAVVPKIKQQTTVAILLPDEFPNTVQQQSLYAQAEASTNSYEITLTSRPNCGANACLVGLFQAQRDDKMLAAFHARHDDTGGVLLTGNVSAYYKPVTCGGSCTPPSIAWVYDGVLYSMQLEVQWKARLEPQAAQAFLVHMANSALQAGPR